MSTSGNISDEVSWESESSDLESNSDFPDVLNGSSSECESDSSDDSSNTVETSTSPGTESSNTSSDFESECSSDFGVPESDQRQER